MKILIAYDGTVCSDNAIIDLRRAGLPLAAEAMVLSVADISSPLVAVPFGATAAGPAVSFGQGMENDEPGLHELRESRLMSSQGAARLRADFPDWKISTETWVDSAGAAIIRKAHTWEPDLIVVGSHGRSGFSRLVLGSVSLQVLHQVSYSVRISRHHLHPQDRAIRLVVAVDGSNNSRGAVQAIGARNWPAGTEVRVLGVMDTGIALSAATTLEGTIPVTAEEELRKCLCCAARDAAQELKKSGLLATPQLLAGKPDEVIIAEAEDWSADAIFLGGRQLSGLGRFLLGSVSSSVAARAHCSVEVVRPQ